MVLTNFICAADISFYGAAYALLEVILYFYQLSASCIDTVVNMFYDVTSVEKTSGFFSLWKMTDNVLTALEAIAIGLMMVYFFMKLSDLYIQGGVTKEKVFSFLFSFGIAAVLMSGCKDLPKTLLNLGTGLGELVTDQYALDNSVSQVEEMCGNLITDVSLKACWDSKGNSKEATNEDGKKISIVGQVAVFGKALAWLLQMILPMLLLLIINVFALGNFIGAGVEAIVLAWFSPIAIADIYGHGGTITDSNGFRYMKRMIASTLAMSIMYLDMIFCNTLMFGAGGNSLNIGGNIIQMLSIAFTEFTIIGGAKELSRTIMGA
jgi:hypothetical protein